MSCDLKQPAMNPPHGPEKYITQRRHSHILEPVSYRLPEWGVRKTGHRMKRELGGGAGFNQGKGEDCVSPGTFHQGRDL